MYFEMFLAVTIVLVLVNTFIILLLVRLSKRVKKQIEANVVNQLSAYDSLIGVKSDELHRMKTDAESLLAVSPIGTAGDSGRVKDLSMKGLTRKSPDYLDGRLAERYNIIKRNFAFDKEKVVREVCDEVGDRPLSAQLASLDEKLSMDTVYAILGTEAEKQTDELAKLLDGGERTILDEYLKEYDGFDILDFKQYVSAMHRKSSEIVYVRTGEKEDNFENLGENIRTVYDPNICEGLVVVCGNTLYDYSLQKKEINS